MAQAIASSTLERSVQATNEWLHELAERLDVDEDTAVQVLRTGLHVIRDSVGVDEAAHLGAQLPVIVRGLYYHQWDPRHGATGHGRDETISRLRTQPPFSSHGVDPEAALEAVGAVLASRIDWGQVTDVIDQAPGWVGRLLKP